MGNSKSRGAVLAVFAVLCMLLTACGNETSLPESVLSEVPTATSSETATYQQITQEEAEEMMRADNGHIIVDVRQQDEFGGIIDLTGEVVAYQ